MTSRRLDELELFHIEHPRASTSSIFYDIISFQSREEGRVEEKSTLPWGRKYRYITENKGMSEFQSWVVHSAASMFDILDVKKDFGKYLLNGKLHTVRPKHVAK